MEGRIREEKMDIRVQKSRESIENAFVDLVLAHGFEKVTVSAVIQKARVNRATFYKYYPDKYMLAASISKELIANLETYVRKRISLNPTDELISWTNQFYSIFYNDRKKVYALMQIHVKECDFEQEMVSLLKRFFYAMPVCKGEDPKAVEMSAKLWANAIMVIVEDMLMQGKPFSESALFVLLKPYVRFILSNKPLVLKE